MPQARIAIVGAPNVGKSTLFNRLAGRRRSLVGKVPGLTRDVIEARAVLAGGTVTVVDTGGLMPPGAAPLAGAVRSRALDAARGCDLVILVVDARQGRTALDEDLARLVRRAGRPILLVVNKVDSPDEGAAAADFAPLGLGEAVSISAEHGLGVSELHAAVEARLPALGDAERERPEMRVAIAGRPNVGKSSLLNALLGSERALVDEAPGTTRDPVDSVLEHGGRAYRFVDTAGMRRRGRVEWGAEALSVAAARRIVESCDVALVLLDASQGVVAQDLHVLGIVAGGEGGRVRPLVVLLNKTDLLRGREDVRRRVEEVRVRLKFAPFAPILPISALRRRNLDGIFETLDEVESESNRFVSTTDLNDWLHEATASHRPPARGGRPLDLVFATQASAGPPAFVILTNRPGAPHFSYARYLENSLRRRFGLSRTPIVLRFRARARRARVR